MPEVLWLSEMLVVDIGYPWVARKKDLFNSVSGVWVVVTLLKRLLVPE